MKIQAIVPSAGMGSRLQSDIPKPLISLKGKPLFIYALESLSKCSLIESIVVVADKDNLSEFKKIIGKYNIPKISQVVVGGETRRDSVFNGLKALDDDTDIVVIHDGARPLISLRVIEESIKACYEEVAVIVSVPIKPTIKRVNRDELYVEGTLDRSLLWEVQTPQVFRKDIIIRAHNEGKGLQATDDAFLVERLGERVKVITGDYSNIKITTQEDLSFAERILEKV